MDTAVALAVVALAALHVLRRARRVLWPEPSSSGACGGCAKACVSVDEIRDAVRLP